MATVGSCELEIESLSPAPGQQCSPFGRKTDPREHSSLRFSQELPAKWLFRSQMGPKRLSASSTVKVVRRNCAILENTHMGTQMPPAAAVYPEIRNRKQRSPNLVHGTLFHGLPPPHDPLQATGKFIPALREWTASEAAPESDIRRGTSPDLAQHLSVPSSPQDQAMIRTLDFRTSGPHLVASRRADDVG
jgi:hypothetical protein